MENKKSSSIELNIDIETGEIIQEEYQGNPERMVSGEILVDLETGQHQIITRKYSVVSKTQEIPNTENLGISEKKKRLSSLLVRQLIGLKLTDNEKAEIEVLRYLLEENDNFKEYQ